MGIESKQQLKTWASLKNINVYVAHIGVGILIIGITVSSVFKTEESHIIKEGESIEVSDVNILLNNVKSSQDKNFEKLRAKFVIKKNTKNIGVIEAGKNYYLVSKVITTEAGILHQWFRDIYIVVGDKYENEWSIKVHINPLVNLIWFGSFIMFLSGLIGVVKK